MSAAGLSPAQLLKPFMILAVLVSMLVGAVSLWMMPASFRQIRDLLTLIRSDFLSRVVREGAFTNLDAGLVFHYRERGPSGELMGVFIQDRRDPQQVSSYLAETGVTAEIEGRSYLVLDKGNIQRRQPNARDAAIVAFERYAIDLSQFGGKGDDSYKPRERTTMELIRPDPGDQQVQKFPGRFRSELHDRFANPLYPFAAALIAFAALGQARTTRQGRGAAIAAAVLAFGALRLLGVGATTMATRSAAATPLLYLVPLLGCAAATAMIVAPQALTAPMEAVSDLISRVVQRFARSQAGAQA
jgi:lipopolysaccharide export system permease protein